MASALGISAGDLVLLGNGAFDRMEAIDAYAFYIAIIIVYLFYLGFSLLLIVMFILRIAVINLLIAISPLALGLWILPATEGYGRKWLSLFMVTLFMHSLQLLAMAMAIGIVNSVMAQIDTSAGANIEMDEVLAQLVLGTPAHVCRLQAATHPGTRRSLRRRGQHSVLHEQHRRSRPGRTPDSRHGHRRYPGSHGRGRCRRRGMVIYPSAELQTRIISGYVLTRRSRASSQSRRQLGRMRIPGQYEALQTMSNYGTELVGFVVLMALAASLCSGVLFMTSSGDPRAVDRARAVLLSAVVAWILAATSFLCRLVCRFRNLFPRSRHPLLHTGLSG